MATFQNRDECLNKRDQSLDNRDESLSNPDGRLNNGARRERGPTRPRVGRVRGGVVMLLALLCAAAFGVGATAQSDFYDLLSVDWSCNGWSHTTVPGPAIASGTGHYQIGDWKFEVVQVNRVDDMEILVTNLASLNTWRDFISTSQGPSFTDYTDTSAGGARFQLIFGTSSSDYLDCLVDANVVMIFGFGGDDTIVDAGVPGGPSRVAAFGGDGDDDISMQNVGGNCFLYGDWIELTGTATWTGEDEIHGSEYSDWIVGGDADDDLFGWGGSDVIFGDDSLDTDSTAVVGDDYIEGGDNDSGGIWWGDVIFGGDGADYIWGDDSQAAITGTDPDYIDGNAGDDTINGQENGDHLFGGIGEDQISGGDGNDYIDGGDDDDQLLGWSGNDTIYGGGGRDDIHGDGNVYAAPSPGIDTLFGGDGDDFIRGGPGDDFLYGEGGDDALDGGAGEDTLEGGAGRDFLYDNDGTDGDHLYGGDDDDLLWSEDASMGSGDTIDGGAGTDTYWKDAVETPTTCEAVGAGQGPGNNFLTPADPFADYAKWPTPDANDFWHTAGHAGTRSA